ncbi:MAG: N-6 DNA methylase, partial [Polaribacter sp.]
MGFSKKEHLQNNIEAIKIVLILEKTQRQANTKELEILQKYVGFGGLKCVLHPANSFSDMVHWSNSEINLFPLVSELHRTLQENTPDEKTYKRYIDSIRSSVLTAFYTPNELVQKLGETLQNNDIIINRFLDPSAGMGVFLSALGNNNAVAFEKDVLTAKMLQYTHPKITVNAQGFETIDNRFHNYFDLVSSNIPFGDISVFDPDFSKSKDEVRVQASKSIHNYFFLKSVDTLREGGLLAFITSQGVLNSGKNEPIRKKLLENTHLISAIRLPNNLFVDNAGTEVGSDFVLLQKDSKKEQLSSLEQEFIESYKTEKGISNSRLFQSFDNIVANNSFIDTDPYGQPAIIHLHTEGIVKIAKDFASILQKDIKANFNKNLYLQEPQKQQKTLSTNIKPQKEPIKNQEEPIATLYDLFNFTEEERSPNYKAKKTARTKKQKSGVTSKKAEKPPKISEEPKPFTGELLNHYKEGCLVRFENQLGYLKSFPQNPTFHPLYVNSLQQKEMERYIPLRDTYFELYQKELETQTEHPKLREELNKYYDVFVKESGYLNSRSSTKLLKMDAIGNEILYLERSQGETFRKADIFHRPVAFNPNEITQVETPNEALSASLNKFSKVDISYMQEISGFSETDLNSTLNGSIFYHPLEKEFQVTDLFLA